MDAGKGRKQDAESLGIHIVLSFTLGLRSQAGAWERDRTSVGRGRDMSVESKVPAIRFKGFSEEWEERELGTICLIGDIDHKMPQSIIDGIPYLMTGDFFGINGLDFENAKLISNEDYEQLSKKIKPEVGDILFARYASVGAVRYVETQIKFLISYSCAILKSNDISNGKYLFYYLQANEIQRQIELEINTGSQRNIGIDSLKKLTIYSPIKREQAEVANFLTNLDTLMTQHQQKHDKLLNLKKSLLEKMFPKQGTGVPEIRFKGFSGEWEEKKLKNIVDNLSGGASIAPSDYQKKGKRTIPKGAVNSTGIADLSGSKFISLDFFEKNILSRAYSGDLVTSLRDLVPTAPNMGRVVKIKEPKEEFLMPQGVYKLALEKGVDENFVITYSNSELFRKIISREKNGSTQVHIRNGEFLDIEIIKPKSEEQTKIGNLFKNLDTLLSHHQTQLKKLKQIKQACLSKMFV